MARGLKFPIYVEEGLYYRCSEKKGTDTAKLICVFVFAYAKSRFSHDEAHMISDLERIVFSLLCYFVNQHNNLDDLS